MDGKRIVFVGAGNMAEAIMAGLVQDSRHQGSLIAMNKSNNERLTYIYETYGVSWTRDVGQAFEQADVIILATKPKDAEEAIANINSEVRPHHLIISVMAGLSTEYLSKLLGTQNPIVRVMPNTSSVVGESATGIAAGEHAGFKHLSVAEDLFSSIGTTTVVPEDQLHLVTGLSGSGPAYFYKIVESMEQAAVELGLDEEAAKTLVRQTMIGAAQMLKTTGEAPGDLRHKVTSPGGTTEAGLKALEEEGLEDILKETVKRAMHRSESLGKQPSK